MVPMEKDSELVKAALSALKAFQKLKVLVVGDIILDQYIWGKVERICPEAPVPVVEVTKTDNRLGGAGNVVSNLAELGISVSVAGVIGDDPEGALVRDLCSHRNVETVGLLSDSNYPTSTKTRVIAHAQQVVRIDREKRKTQSEQALSSLQGYLHESLETFDAIVLSDYGQGVFSSDTFDTLRKLVSSGKTGLDKRPVLLDPYPSNYGELSQGRVADIIKPNRKEAEQAAGIAFSDRDQAVKGGKSILNLWDTELLVVTLSEDGMMMLSKDDESKGLFMDTMAREVFDVSGAGDTVAAVLAAAFGAGSSREVAGFLSNVAAGIVVSEVGTVPIRMDQMLSALKE